ncbi:MAG: ECF transporter S component [Clostridia bacterium]|nr:ECF transporter S component [Clostridia bacterium]
MKSARKNQEMIKKLTLVAMFTAIVAILAYMGGFIKIGALASISLTLIPVVLGGAICGPLVGAWLGLVSGAVFFATADAAYWLGLSAGGTIVTVLLKGLLAGLSAALAYKLLVKVNRYLAILVSAVVAPVVNTSLFILGCFVFFFDNIVAGAAASGQSLFVFIVVGYIGLNFVFELLANILVSPALLRVLNVKNGAIKAKSKE